MVFHCQSRAPSRKTQPACRARSPRHPGSTITTAKHSASTCGSSGRNVLRLDHGTRFRNLTSGSPRAARTGRSICVRCPSRTSVSSPSPSKTRRVRFVPLRKFTSSSPDRSRACFCGSRILVPIAQRIQVRTDGYYPDRGRTRRVGSEHRRMAGRAKSRTDHPSIADRQSERSPACSHRRASHARQSGPRHVVRHRGSSIAGIRPARYQRVGLATAWCHSRGGTTG